MMKFAVVDIETTGLVHQGHGITEVAVVHVDESGISLAFESLISPSRSVPGAVTHLTGIDDALLFQAPTFAEKAAELAKALEGRIFVAHQVNFDYTFLKQAFEQQGVAFQMRRLCTVRLARRTVSGLASARLKDLCAALGVQNSAPHRAYGDAMATAEVLQQLILQDKDGHLQDELKRSNRSAVLPAHLSSAQVKALPEGPGVYYFFGSHAERPIYIGKAVNVQKRVWSHFSSPGSSRRKQLFQREVSRVDCRSVSSEHMALLLEDAEIKRLRPSYNIAQKHRQQAVAVRLYETRGGSRKVAILRSAGHADDLACFISLSAARSWIIEQVRLFGFDIQRAGLAAVYAPHHTDSSTFDNEQGAFAAFLQHVKDGVQNANYALLEQVKDGGRSFAVIRNGVYRGYGFLPLGAEAKLEMLDSHLNPAPDSVVARAVLRNMCKDKNIERIDLNQ